MANSLGTLTLQLITRIGGFTQPLNQAEKHAKKTMGNVSSSADAMGTAVKGAIAGIATAMAGFGLNKLVDVQREFDKLNAGLITATGSTENAGEAFKVLQDFAATTPYSLAQAVEGFTKLVNLGLDPSERALQSYGNTASAMGKDLMQMVEAVADASTGEFERLKEFGIKAKAQGDSISVSFQGTTTKIQNNAAAIEEYLIKLGEDKFGDAMSLRAKTLDGAISNLGDTWDGLFRTVSSSGIGDAIKDAVLEVSESLGELSDRIESGEIPAQLDGITSAFSLFSDDVSGDIKTIVNTIIGLTSVLTGSKKSMADDLNDMANEFNDFKMRVQIAAAFTAAAILQMKTGDSQTQNLKNEIALIKENTLAKKDRIKTSMVEADLLKTYAELTKEEAKNAPKGSGLGRFRKAGDGADSSSGKAADKAAKDAESALKRAQSSFNSLQEMAQTEVEKSNKTLDDRLKLISQFATKGSAEYKRLTDFALKQNKSELLQAEIQHDAMINDYRDMVGTRMEIMKNEATARTKGIFANTLLSETEKKEALGHLKEFYQNKQDLMELDNRQEIAGFYEVNNREIENIRNRYAFEREQIKLNLDLSKAERDARLAGLANQEGNDVKKLQEGSTSSFFGLQASLTGEDANYQLSQQKEERYKIIQDALDAEAVQYEQANALRLQVDEDYNKARQDLQMKQMGNILDSTTEMFGQLFGKQSNAYRVMFAASKAFSIAQSIMAIQTGIAQAAALPFPVNLGAIASVIAATASIVSTISSVTMPTGQAHDGIDYVPKEGTWLLDKGERVLSPRQNADFTRMMRDNKALSSMQANGQSQSMMPTNNNVSMQNKIINLIDPNLLGDYLRTAQGEKILVNTIGRAKSEVNQVLR